MPAGRYKRLELCRRSDRFFCRQLTPGSVPGRPGDSLLMQQKTPQGVEVRGLQEDVACDQDPVTPPEEGDMPERVVGRPALPGETAVPLKGQLHSRE